ncbi:hypothetical protein [Marinobacter salarius]|uniref:hypothetical protein n=1 Tax=Marinobacter salarius TaxID=1420917 RepID=UPI003D0A8497
MNTSIHSTKLEDVEVLSHSEQGRADFREQGGRNGTLSMFFESADDCQAAANGLASLAKQMRKQEVVG